MSGGKYGYIHYKTAELIDQGRAHQVRSLVRDLSRRLPCDHPAVRKSAEVVAMVDEFEQRIRKLATRELMTVWDEFDRVECGDSGMSELQDAAQAFVDKQVNEPEP